jgi:hypothetical protein
MDDPTPAQAKAGLSIGHAVCHCQTFEVAFTVLKEATRMVFELEYREETGGLIVDKRYREPSTKQMRAGKSTQRLLIEYQRRHCAFRAPY